MVQFRAVFFLLSRGRPMTDFGNFRGLFEILIVSDVPKKHWSMSVGWEMADHLAKTLAEHTKSVLFGARFLSLSADEVTVTDGQSWLSIHCYMCVSFKRVPILLSLSRLHEGNTASAVGEAIQAQVSHHSGLDPLALVSRIMCFGADGDSVFQGCRNGVTVTMKAQAARSCLGCIVWRIGRTWPWSLSPICRSWPSLRHSARQCTPTSASARSAIWSFRSSPTLWKQKG